MNYTLGDTTAVTVVTLAEAKANLRVDHDYQNDMIQSFINASVEMAQNYTGRLLANRPVTVTHSTFLQNMQLRYTPVVGNVVIVYRDVNDTEATLATTAYEVVIASSGELSINYLDTDTLPEVYDRSDAVTITYTAGTAENAIPEVFKTYVKLMVNKLYENPGDTPYKYRSFAESLLSGYKVQLADVYE